MTEPVPVEFDTYNEPATADDKGIELIRHLIVDGRLTVQVVP